MTAYLLELLTTYGLPALFVAMMLAAALAVRIWAA